MPDFLPRKFAAAFLHRNPRDSGRKQPETRARRCRIRCRYAGLECSGRRRHQPLRGRHRGRRTRIGRLFGARAGRVDRLHQSCGHDAARRRPAHARRAGALRRPGVFDRAGNDAGARQQRRRQSGRMVPGRRHVLFPQRVGRHQGRPCGHRQLRIGGEVRLRLGRPVPRAGGNAARSYRSFPRPRGASTRTSRWAQASTRCTASSRTKWPSTTSSVPMAAFRSTTTRGASAPTWGCSTKWIAARASASPTTRPSSSISAHRPSGTVWRRESGRCLRRGVCSTPMSISASRSRRA